MTIGIGVFAAIFNDNGHILCVRANYGAKLWTTPGGGMEAGESLTEALIREVKEESGYIVEVSQVVEVESKPFKNEIVVFMRANILGRGEWQPNDEISDIGFFSLDDLPIPMESYVIERIKDAFQGNIGVIRVHEKPQPVIGDCQLLSSGLSQ